MRRRRQQATGRVWSLDLFVWTEDKRGDWMERNKSNQSVCLCASVEQRRGRINPRKKYLAAGLAWFVADPWPTVTVPSVASTASTSCSVSSGTVTTFHVLLDLKSYLVLHNYFLIVTNTKHIQR